MVNTSIYRGASRRSTRSGPLFSTGSFRNHALDPADDQRFIDFQEGIAQQDKPIAESQKPEQIPVDLRDEFHIRVPDAASMQYRRQLAKIDQEYIYHDAEPSPV